MSKSLNGEKSRAMNAAEKMNCPHERQQGHPESERLR